MKIPVLQPGFNFFSPAGYSAAVAPNRAENAYADYVLDIGKRILDWPPESPDNQYHLFK